MARSSIGWSTSATSNIEEVDLTLPCGDIRLGGLHPDSGAPRAALDEFIAMM